MLSSFYYSVNDGINISINRIDQKVDQIKTISQYNDIFYAKPCGV